MNNAVNILPDASGNWPKFQQAGSNDYYSLSATASSTESSFALPFTAREILLINDGGADIQFGLGGNPANPAPQNLGTVYDDIASQWTYAPAWSADATFHAYGTQISRSGTPGATAILRPIGNVQSLTWAMIMGSAVGIAQIDVSQDGGTTWVQPSTIAGITRSDGASGTALNTFDGYVNLNSLYYNITYNLPTSSPWALRITVSATKNSSSTATTLYSDAGLAGTTPAIFPIFRSITVKPGEPMSLEIQTNKVNVYCNSGSQACRIIARA